jgi:hypothetical protein
MTVVVGAMIGLLAAVGLLLIGAAVTGHQLPARPRSSPRTRSSAAGTARSRAVAAAIVVGFACWLLSGLIAIGLLLAGGVVAVPLFRQADRERRLLVARTEALAGCAESLRDYVKSHAGLRQSVVASLNTVDPVIRPEVEALAADLDTESPDVALERFAARLADPVGDLLATALSVALGESGARDIASLLGQLAQDARDEVSGIRRVSVAHEKAFGTARAMAIVVVATAAGMFAVNGAYLRVYRTASGQVVLLLVAGVALLAVWGLVRMARPVRPLRVLASEPADVSPTGTTSSGATTTGAVFR